MTEAQPQAKGFLKFFRMPDGTYGRDGELSAGTGWVTLEIGPRPNRSAHFSGCAQSLMKAVAVKLKDQMVIIEDAIAKNQAAAEWYILRPAAAPTAMDEGTKAKLREASERRRAEKKAGPAKEAEAGPAGPEDEKRRNFKLDKRRAAAAFAYRKKAGVSVEQWKAMDRATQSTALRNTGLFTDPREEAKQ